MCSYGAGTIPVHSHNSTTPVTMQYQPRANTVPRSVQLRTPKAHFAPKMWTNPATDVAPLLRDWPPIQAPGADTPVLPLLDRLRRRAVTKQLRTADESIPKTGSPRNVAGVSFEHLGFGAQGPSGAARSGSLASGRTHGTDARLNPISVCGRFGRHCCATPHRASGPAAWPPELDPARTQLQPMSPQLGPHRAS